MNLFTIFKSKEGEVKPAFVLAPLHRSTKDGKEALSEYLYLSFSADYHPANRHWMRDNVVFAADGYSATHMNNTFFLHPHLPGIQRYQTMENYQDSMVSENRKNI